MYQLPQCLVSVRSSVVCDEWFQKLTLHTTLGLTCMKQIQGTDRASVLHSDIRSAGDKYRRSFTEEVNLGLGFLLA